MPRWDGGVRHRLQLVAPPNVEGPAEEQLVGPAVVDDTLLTSALPAVRKACGGPCGLVLEALKTLASKALAGEVW